MSDDKNILKLTNCEQDERRAMLAKVIRALPGAIEEAKVISKIKRINYDAYIEEGFTPEQAIALIK